MKEIFKWLAILGRLSNQYADQQLKELEINSSHHMFIVQICKMPGITQDKLKTRVFIHPSNVTRALDYLEKAGYIIRETLPEDKRTSRLFPTKKALEASGKIEQVVEEWANLLTSQMNQEQKKEFAALLRQAGTEATEYFYHK